VNCRGILFTGIVFLIILSIISLNSVIRENRSYEQQLITPAKILAVSGIYENISESVIELKKGSAATEIDRKVVPFDYGFDGNSLELEFRLPFNDSEFDLYFDSLNLSEVILEDKNYDNIFSGLLVDINTIQNAEWGGSEDKFGFYFFCGIKKQQVH